MNKNALRLRTFPFPLKKKVKAWLNSLPPSVITTWEELVRKLTQFTSNQDNKANECYYHINSIYDESLYKVWERYEDLLHEPPILFLNSDIL